MSYKVLEIYRDLPRTNCGDCGKGSCFAFASAVFLEGSPLSACTALDEKLLKSMAAKLGEARAQGEGRKAESHQQALEYLVRKMAHADLVRLAENAGAVYDPGPPEEIRLEFLGFPHRVRRKEVEAMAGPSPSIWVKVFLLIYLTRAKGTSPTGQWVAYRELPNTVSKSKSFEEAGTRIARIFEGVPGQLDEAARSLGGTPERGFGSADRAYVFRALPRVDLFLLFWDRQEDFPARASILIDRGLLDYLDQEAAVFLVEAFANRLMGRDGAEVTP